MQPTPFPPTRADGLARLDAFAAAAGAAYARGRNHDRGAPGKQAVSMLSPYLRHRLLTEHEVLARILRDHGADAAGMFTQQVLWRTYFKGWLEQRPAVWRRFIEQRDAGRRRVRDDARLGERLAAAEQGRTGIEGFDDWARELQATGYLHNHARMWFASIWIFTLRLPWELGADFFLRELLDADAASNILSWRWVAGLHTPGKTYLATADNIARCTGGRFDPRGLAQDVEAVTESPLPAPRLPDCPQAPAGRAPSLLLVTGEDLNPETVFGADADVRGALVCARVDTGQAWPWGPRAAAFVDEATADTAQRVATHFDAAVDTITGMDPAEVAAAARRCGASRVLAAQAPVGPVADALELLGRGLARHDLPLVVIRRAWDRQFWPHATRGYFPFKRELPRLLQELGLQARA